MSGIKAIVKPGVQELKFPMLMYCKRQYPERIILMTGVTKSDDRLLTGTVLTNSKAQGQPIGHHSDKWDINVFEPFDGSVELSNGK